MQFGSLGKEDPLEKEMATHPSILAWRIPLKRSLAGCSPWGRKESDTTEQLTHTHTHTTFRMKYKASVSAHKALCCRWLSPAAVPCLTLQSSSWNLSLGSLNYWASSSLPQAVLYPKSSFLPAWMTPPSNFNKATWLFLPAMVPFIFL